MEIVTKGFVMPGVHASLKTGSGSFARFWLLCRNGARFGSQLAQRAPAAHSAPVDWDHGGAFALESPGSVLDQQATDFPDPEPRLCPPENEEIMRECSATAQK